MISVPRNSGKRRAFTLVELLVVMSVIGIVTVMALPALNWTLQEEKLKLAARKYTSALRSARQEALARQTRMMLTVRLGRNSHDQDVLFIETYAYEYQPNLIAAKDKDGAGVKIDANRGGLCITSYRGKNYNFALGDKNGNTDPTKLPDPVRRDEMPVGVRIAKDVSNNDMYPGYQGHRDDMGGAWFVYPDPNGRYHVNCDRMLLWNSKATQLADSLIQTTQEAVDTGLIRDWVDMNPNGSIDDGTSADMFETGFIDIIDGGRVNVRVAKATGYVYPPCTE